MIGLALLALAMLAAYGLVRAQSAFAVLQEQQASSFTRELRYLAQHTNAHEAGQVNVRG